MDYFKDQIRYFNSTFCFWFHLEKWDFGYWETSGTIFRSVRLVTIPAADLLRFLSELLNSSLEMTIRPRTKSLWCYTLGEDLFITFVYDNNLGLSLHLWTWAWCNLIFADREITWDQEAWSLLNKNGFLKLKNR